MWFTDHIPTTCWPHAGHIQITYQPHTDHIPTTYWSQTNHIPATYQPHTDHILTTYQPHVNHIPTTYWPHTNNIPTAYRPHTDHMLTTYQPHINHIPTIYWQHTDHLLTRSTCLTITLSTSRWNQLVVASRKPRVWAHWKSSQHQSGMITEMFQSCTHPFPSPPFGMQHPLPLSSFPCPSPTPKLFTTESAFTLVACIPQHSGPCARSPRKWQMCRMWKPRSDFSLQCKETILCWKLSWASLCHRICELVKNEMLHVYASYCLVTVVIDIVNEHS